MVLGAVVADGGFSEQFAKLEDKIKEVSDNAPRDSKPKSDMLWIS